MTTQTTPEGMPNLTTLSPRAEIVDVTPEIAQAMLERNTQNRTLKPGAVQQYARDMQSGRWRFAGDPIRFDTTGRLLDGQNRLSAVIEAGRPIRMNVMTGLAPEAQLVMDSGVKRSAADQLRMKGEHYSDRVASAARIAILVDHDCLRSLTYRPTTTEIIEWVEDNSEIADFAPNANSIRRVLGGSPSGYLWALWKTNRVDPMKAVEFWDGIFTGANLAENDPRLAFRSFMARAAQRATGRSGTVVATPQMLFALAKAWQAFRNDAPLSVIRITKRSDLNSPDFG